VLNSSILVGIHISKILENINVKEGMTSEKKID